ncbi:unnamed protein product [Polarella glacialis]|uniref:Uncharacterized protein n=1 Tax=Polarella glacialis TaxID=89957 RepID=A0A813IJK5_POLGL|nr:unnamed protein product [Polarella glacialis]|mmetsp:Transcript_24893/g.44289  ORF Transcript_24893/g.44289 Transcript_24893/m.44289 type:complete len:371 (+) Transcript_24893:67-1179(+)
MSSSSPLLPEGGGAEPTTKDQLKKGLRVCLFYLGTVFLVVFILAWCIQVFMYWVATNASGCSASALEGYDYPGGGVSEAGGASFNILPGISLLAEREPMWYGAAFDVIPSNEASTVAAAPAGTWWRTWGPIFATYTYEDVANSRTTVYMRRNLLRMGSSHTIARCDGQGPKVTFTEGSNFLANRVRKVIGMNQGMTFKIFMDDKLVAVAEETSHGFESLTFREEDSGRSESSSVLKERHFHGLYDLWLVKNDEKSILPNYVASATTLLLAFHTINHDATSKGAASNESPNFLEKPPPTLAAEQVLDEQQESSSSVTGQATAVAQAAEQAFASVAQKVADGASAEIREELPDRRQQPEEKKADQEAVDVAP